MWSDFASPLQFMGPKRYMSPALDLAKLDVDVVLLSHSHYDHLDYDTAKQIGNKSTWIAPLGVAKILNSMGITNVIELDWWRSHNFVRPQGNLDITLTPTKHWTSRNPFDRNKSLWGSFVVKSADKSFFFGGDSAYHEVFKLIGEKYGPFDFSALPVGAYKPRWFLKDNHVNPAEAVQIHKDIKSKQTVAIHWGTFPLSDEDYVEPPLELARMRDIMNVSRDSFFSLMHGETWNVGDAPKNDFASLNPLMYEEYLSHYSSKLKKKLASKELKPN
jgi:N-acyl-phosphatidylethanolamine-hydrolysing phospholipase D